MSARETLVFKIPVSKHYYYKNAFIQLLLRCLRKKFVANIHSIEKLTYSFLHVKEAMH